MAGGGSGGGGRRQWCYDDDGGRRGAMTAAAVDGGQQRQWQQRRKEGGGWIGQGCCVFVCGKKSDRKQLLSRGRSRVFFFARMSTFLLSSKKVLASAFFSSDKNAP